MPDETITRRRLLRTSGATLAALTGASLGGTAAANVDPGGGGGGGGGGGSTGSKPSVTTGIGYALSSCDVTVNGYLDSLGSSDTADVWFDFGLQGEGLPNYTNLKLMDTTGSFCDGDGCWYDSFGCLDSGTYEYRAVAVNDWGRTEGAIRTFTV